MRLAARSVGIALFSLSATQPKLSKGRQDNSESPAECCWALTKSFLACSSALENLYVKQIHLSTIKAKWKQIKKLTSLTQPTQFNIFNCFSREGAPQLGKLLSNLDFPPPQTWVVRTGNIFGHASSFWTGSLVALNTRVSKAVVRTRREGPIAVSINSWKEFKNGR